MNAPAIILKLSNIESYYGPIMAIRGISQKKLDAMRPYVTVSAPPLATPPALKSAPPAKKATP